ncbi:DUF1588 domain-containing protein [Catenovulum maritimum]|uniref:DUF1588 domain-containing protein n=1 Tax=Catenovulum maritimum TaxID=1513271 RepID=A0A0J8JM05_9ALTE|nr:DUF1588 domain-containing protein [Catenovulum maritimum]KMT65601.1 hypothetical protein XM47_07845 [Catenovulum maritimum]
MTFYKNGIALFCSFILIACGGGGSDGVTQGLAPIVDVVDDSNPDINLPDSNQAQTTPEQNLAFYSAKIAKPVVDNLCISCHVTDGLASATRLVFQPTLASRGNQSTTDVSNKLVFQNFISSVENGDFILIEKASGKKNHGGGTVLEPNTQLLNEFSTFINLVKKECVTNCAEDSSNSGTQTESESESETDNQTENEANNGNQTETGSGEGNTETDLDASDFFSLNISQQIIISNCVNCHTASGNAKDSQLIFQPNYVENNPQLNFSALSEYISRTNDNAQNVLDKVRGLNDHGGGVRLTSNSVDFLNLTDFLNLLGKDVESNSQSKTLFSGASYLSNQETFKRAAFLLTASYPKQAQLDKVANMSDSELKQEIVSLMQGEGFHQFLIRSSNDKLLTDKWLSEWRELVNNLDNYYPEYTNKLQEIAEKYKDETYEDADRLKRNEENNYRKPVSYGLARAPLELIAYVVENDKPYSEILTADYTMVTKESNSVLKTDADFSSTDKTWLPGKDAGLVRHAENRTYQYNRDLAIMIYNGGGIETAYPHAGILNSLAFLRRYPSTATNRNRARSRWTYMHFLGLDIEKSAARTTDPEALSDNNNPTLNNSNCTVCHQTLDPLAGAFQNYGDEGFYRDSIGGLDSLPNSYKRIYDEDIGRWIANELYQDGDTWYSDMLVPGFENDIAPTSETSLSWVATQITQDERFASATVKFWWPAIFAAEVAQAPSVETDQNYQSQKVLFEAQSDFISEQAENFINSNMNLKSLLADLIVSDWFRLSTLDRENANPNAAEALTQVGTERLLTPEELAAKTKSLTGFEWGISQYRDVNYLMDDYLIYYGGMDSDAVTERAREVNSVMANVAATHAIEASCPIVISEFNQVAEARKLFTYVEPDVVPGAEFSTEFEINKTSTEDMQLVEFDMNLTQGSKTLSALFVNDYSDDTSDRNVFLNYIEIIGPQNTVVVSDYAWSLTQYSEPDIELNSCTSKRYNSAQSANHDIAMYCNNSGFEFNWDASVAGVYKFKFIAYAEQSGEELAKLRLAIQDDLFGESTTGTLAIKTNIQALHKILLDEHLTLDSPELEATYQLFVETWQDKLNRVKSGDERNHIVEAGTRCANLPQWALGYDNSGTLTAWRTVISYLMMDYKYTHH